MTNDRFRECLIALGWSHRALAARLQRDERMVRRWGSGDMAVPANVAEWLETLALVHEMHPGPEGSTGGVRA